MLTLPLAGDTIETHGGVQHTIIGYSAYAKAPSVLVETSGTEKPVLVPFDEIKTLNGTPVFLTSGKILKANSAITRKIQLPQVYDKVLVDNIELKIKTIKLHERGDLTSGIVLTCINEETDESRVIRLFDVDRIIRANGNSVQSTNALKKLYSDYLGVNSNQ